MARFEIFHNGRTLRQRLTHGLWRLMAGRPLEELELAFLYRPDFFTKPLLPFVQTLLRGASPWTAAQRELFAAFVSKVNECPFCVGTHGGFASHRIGRGRVQAILERWNDGAADAITRAACAFLEKLTRAPEQVSHTDVERLRGEGLSDTAIRDLVYLSATFCLMNRVANAVGAEAPSVTSREARLMYWIGYR